MALKPMSRWNRILLAIYLVLLLVSVLTPLPIPPLDPVQELLPPHSLLPLAWLADAIRNLILFAPLGAAVVAAGRRPRFAVGFALALSITIESIQLWIPGRYPSILDVLTNTLGAAAGAGLSRIWKDLIRPSRASAIRLSWAASTVSATLLWATAFLLRPALLPPGTYFGGWTPDLGHLSPYSGRVLEARVGSVPIVEAGRAANSEALREALSRNEPILIRAIAGSAPPSLAPLVMIHDSSQHDILAVGLDGTDLVIRRRLAAESVGLENPPRRLPRAMAGLDVGDPFVLRILPTEPHWQLELDAKSIAFDDRTPGHTWTLFFRFPGLTKAMSRLLDALWIVGLAFPAVFWARRSALAWLGVAAFGLTFAALPLVGTLAFAPAREWLALVAGVTLAIVGSRRLHAHPQNRNETKPPGSDGAPTGPKGTCRKGTCGTDRPMA